MGLRLLAHYYDRTEALIVSSVLNAEGVPNFVHSYDVLSALYFYEMAFGGYRIMVAEDDLAAAVQIVRAARAAPLLEGERLSTHHLLWPSLVLSYLVWMPLPLRLHRWFDVSKS